MSTRAPLQPAYGIWGENRPRVEQAVRRLVTRVQDEGGLPPERLRASEVAGDAVVAACETLSFAGLRLVLVEGADAWRAADAAPVVVYLAAPNPATCLALLAGAAPTPKLVEAVKRAGTVLDYGPPAKAGRKDRTAWYVSYLAEEVARLGGQVSAPVARRLVERVMVERPDDRRQGITATELTSEAEKLVLYAGDETIAAEMVAELVPRHPDARTYELADAVAAGDARRAYGLLQDLATGDQPAAPIVVHSGLTRHFRTLAEAQELGPAASADALTEATGVSGYPARKAVEQARALPVGAARAAVVRLAALELDLRVSTLRQLGRSPDDGARLVLELATRDLLTLARGGG